MIHFVSGTFEVTAESQNARTAAAAERYELEQALQEADRRRKSERRARRRAHWSGAAVRRWVPSPSHW